MISKNTDSDIANFAISAADILPIQYIVHFYSGVYKHTLHEALYQNQVATELMHANITE